jgi:hypothetical protein
MQLIQSQYFDRQMSRGLPATHGLDTNKEGDVFVFLIHLSVTNSSNG